MGRTVPIAGVETIRVLLIEGNGADAQCTRELLGRAAGQAFEVECVRHLEAGLDRLAEGGIDAVLLDTSLPDSQGVDMFEAVVRQAPHVAVVLLADSGADAVAVRTPQDGAEGHVLKRHTNSALLSRTIGHAIAHARMSAVLQASEAKYRAIAEQIPAVIYTARLDEASTREYVGPQIEAMTGFSPAEHAHTPDTWRERLHPEDRERVLAEVARGHETQEPFVSDYRVLARDGRTVWVHDRAVVVRDDVGAPLYLQGTMVDTTEQKQAQQALCREAAVLRGINQVFREASTSRTEQDVARGCLSVAVELTRSQLGFVCMPNDAGTCDCIALSDHGSDACRIPDPDALVMLKDMDVPGIWREAAKHGLSLTGSDPTSHPGGGGTLEAHAPIKSFLGVPLKRGEDTIGLFALANKGSGYNQPDQEAIEALAATFVEASSRKWAEKQDRRPNLALRALSECSQALARITKEPELLGAICRTVVETAGYRLAWVGLAEDDEQQTVRPAAQAGHDDGYLDTVRITWAGNEWGQLPAGAAIRTGEPCVDRNTKGDSASAPWRAEAAKRGFAASAALPLSIDGRVIGSLNVYAAEPDAFDTEEVRTLAELARDLSHGIAALRARTEREHEAAALRASEDAYRTLFEGIADGVVVHDGSGVILEVNEVTCSRLEHARPELQGMNIREIITDEHARRVCQHIQDTVVDGSSAFETVFVSKSGRRIPCEILEHVCEYRGGKAVLSVARDITDRKKAEDERLALLRLHETTLATIPSSLLILDSDLNIMMANQQYLTGEGLELPDVLGKNLAMVVPPSLLAEEHLIERIRAVAENGGRDTFQAMRHSDSRRADRYLNIHICGIQPSAGRPQEPRVLVITEDVTQQKALEDQLRQKAKMESVGRLAGGLAHDFNNTITSVKGYSQMLLKRTESGTEENCYLNRVCELTDQAANLVRQLLAFSRRQPLAPVPLDIGELARNTLDMLRRLIPEDIALEFAGGADVGAIEADPVQIEQVLLNLVINARDAMPTGGKVTIETRNAVLDQDYADRHVGAIPGPYVMLSVTDTGVGMDEETRERIFEPFFTTKEMGRGTGLGLATVYGIVRQHGGYIWVHSVPGKGTTFEVYLPRVDAQAQATVEQPPETTAQRGTESILIVEDERAVGETAQRNLHAQGYNVLYAANADDAELLLEEHPCHIHLLLTDVIMPGRSGRDLFEDLTANRPDLKVLYMSGYDDDVIARHRILDPGVAFIQKPFSPDALARKVRGVLDA